MVTEETGNKQGNSKYISSQTVISGYRRSKCFDDRVCINKVRLDFVPIIIINVLINGLTKTNVSFFSHSYMMQINYSLGGDCTISFHHWNLQF